MCGCGGGAGSHGGGTGALVEALPPPQRPQLPLQRWETPFLWPIFEGRNTPRPEGPRPVPLSSLPPA